VPSRDKKQNLFCVYTTIIIIIIIKRVAGREERGDRTRQS
jgi:hypothetical protein